MKHTDGLQEIITEATHGSRHRQATPSGRGSLKGAELVRGTVLRASRTGCVPARALRASGKVEGGASALPASALCLRGTLVWLALRRRNSRAGIPFEIANRRGRQKCQSRRLYACALFCPPRAPSQIPHDRRGLVIGSA
jgi:hypothetical protein